MTTTPPLATWVTIEISILNTRLRPVWWKRGGAIALIVHTICQNFCGDANGPRGRATAGQLFIMTDGTFNTNNKQAMLFAHELGHNLGINHGGATSLDDKPNYPSLMNGRYGGEIRSKMFCRGLVDRCDVPFKLLDYSSGTMSSLDEDSLDERIGIGFGPVDWDCDGSIDSLPVSRLLLNSDWCNSSSGQGKVLEDYDDWSNIVDLSWTLSPDEAQFLQSITSVSVCGYSNDASLTQIAELSCPEGGVWDEFVEDCLPDQDSDSDGVGDGCDLCPFNPDPCCCDYEGDATNNGFVNFDDIDLLVAYIFQSGPAPSCLDEGDADGSNFISVSDITYLVSYFISGGPAPICGTTGS